ncbi:MAG: hypothetical protein QGH60_00225 [Phycisphaerae bacterium]|jgi:hypothetical protein|nr:hypothetical protein [Phycisphaerae bacterium]
MGSYKYRCPNPKCRKNLMIPSEMQGKEVRCAGCKDLFVAPVRFDVADTLARATSRLLKEIC